MRLIAHSDRMLALVVMLIGGSVGAAPEPKTRLTEESVVGVYHAEYPEPNPLCYTNGHMVLYSDGTWKAAMHHWRRDVFPECHQQWRGIWDIKRDRDGNDILVLVHADGQWTGTLTLRPTIRGYFGKGVMNHDLHLRRLK